MEVKQKANKRTNRQNAFYIFVTWKYDAFFTFFALFETQEYYDKTVVVGRRGVPRRSFTSGALHNFKVLHRGEPNYPKFTHFDFAVPQTQGL